MHQTWNRKRKAIACQPQRQTSQECSSRKWPLRPTRSTRSSCRPIKILSILKCWSKQLLILRRNQVTRLRISEMWLPNLRETKLPMNLPLPKTFFSHTNRLSSKYRSPKLNSSLQRHHRPSQGSSVWKRRRYRRPVLRAACRSPEPTFLGEDSSLHQRREWASNEFSIRWPALLQPGSRVL